MAFPDAVPHASTSADDALPGPRPHPRRRFVLGIASAAAAASWGLPRPGLAAVDRASAPSALQGDDFDLVIGTRTVDYTGTVRPALTVNGSLPGPILRWREGSEVRLRVTNRLATSTSIHWHGILLPADMDGVPGLSFAGIDPGQTFTYRFPVRQSGTYWYHAHTRFQEQVGLYGALVIDPAIDPTGDARHHVDREHVILLSDWTDEDPERIYAKLKKHSDYYNFAQPTLPDFIRDVLSLGLAQAMDRRRMWQQMRMSPTDLSDVSGHTYTYLVNGSAPAGNWTGLFKPGEKIRLRIINGSASTIFDVRIPGLRMTVVAADGQDVAPVSVDEFRISVAETYDVIVEPAEDRAFTFFAQSIDRSGFARATLAPRIGMSATVPVPDPRLWLSMQDMMGAMVHAAPGHDEHAGHHAHAALSAPERPDAHHDHSTHSDPGMGTAAPVPTVRHASTEYGPGVDMRVDTPRTNLDDPGIGLRDNGRRVLTYADLRSIGRPPDVREPSREIELHLTGNMERFIWSFDGLKFSDATPIHLRLGERVRFVIVNDTMMNHPIHLHGMWSDLEDPQGRFQVRKHTINVQPAQRICFGVSADAPGHWAFHCHLLYHMEAGMFRQVVVS